MTKAMNRSTPQGGPISHVFWLTVMDEILRILDKSWVKVVAYGDELVMLVLGMCPTIMCDIMEGESGKVHH